MKRYPAYKDSGVEWIGEIPAHWRVVPAFGVFDHQKIINTGMISNNVLSLSYGRIIPRDVESNFGLLPQSFDTYQLVYPGNIILRLTDLQNDKRSLRVGFVKEEGIITSAYLCLKSSSINSEYAYLLLHNFDTKKLFYNIGGGVRQTMRFEELRRLPILLPDEKEQNLIPKYINHKTHLIDTLIEKKQKQIELLQEQRSAIINQAVTKGLNPNAKMKNSGIEWLGEVPEHWAILKLKHLIKVKDGTHATPIYVNPSNTSYPLVTSKDIKKGEINFDETKHISQEDYVEINKRSDVNKNDIIMPMIGTIGNPVIVDTERPFSIKNVALFKTSISNVIPKYMLFYFDSDFVSKQFELLSRGGVQDFVSLDILRNLIAFGLDRSEQYEIETYLVTKIGKIETAIGFLNTEINELLEYRTTLISEVVTGKIDVRDEVIP